MNKGMKRVIAFVMALVMTFSIQMPQKVEAASASDTYNGGYGIEEILTYYQYFTKENCTLTIHSVGNVAVGGSFSTTDTMGNASFAPGYASHIERASKNGLGLDDYQSTTKAFYYGTASAGQNLDGFTHNPDFMKINENYATIESQSSALVTPDAITVYAVNKEIKTRSFIYFILSPENILTL